MKSWRFFKVIFLLLTVFCESSFFIWADGTGSTGGGSIVKTHTGAAVPADIFYRQNVRKIPYPLDSLFEIQKQAPELYAEIIRISVFVEYRKFGLGKVEQNLPQIEDFLFFRTKKLSNKDDLELKAKLVPVQVAYTYLFTGVLENVLKTQAIIELSPEFFKQTIRIQALIILHEMLHHHKNGVHELIAPFISSLYTVLNTLDRQLKNDLTSSTTAENEASLSLQKYLQYFLKFTYGDSPAKDLDLISSLGGGIIRFDSEPEWEENKNFEIPKPGSAAYIALQSNFVSVDSIVKIRYSEKNLHTFRDNKILNSSLELYHHNACFKNLFVDSRLITFSCKNLTESQFSKVLGTSLAAEGNNIDLKDSDLYSTDVFSNVSVKNSNLSDLDIFGKNRIEHSRIQGAYEQVRSSIDLSINFYDSLLLCHQACRWKNYRSEKKPVSIINLNYFIGSYSSQEGAVVEIEVKGKKNVLKFNDCERVHFDFNHLINSVKMFFKNVLIVKIESERDLRNFTGTQIERRLCKENI